MTTDPKSDLAYIRQLMEDTRKAACLSGGYFIVWGLATGLAIVATWLQLTGVLPYAPFITWTLCFTAGSLGTLYLVRQEKAQAPAGRLIGMVWLALGVTQIILFFAGLGAGAIPGEHMPAIFSSIVGTGVFLTGVLAGLGWLRNLAFGWWAGSALMFVWPGLHVLLIMGLMLFAFYVIPGIVLIRMKQQRQHAVAGA